jgi:8-oxo-dGTP pyrophosphatase MutT (NUDIX family)
VSPADRAVADTPEEWPVHEVERIWDGAAPFSVRRDIISAPDLPDEQFGRLVLEHPGAVVVLALDEEERAFVLHQYRHPASLRFAELPAGLLDKPGEDPLVAARRELQEEALLLAEEWTHLLTTYPSPGLSSERHDIYLATGLSAAPDRGDFEPHHEEADMTSSWVPVSELLDGFLAGRLTDGPLGHAVMAYTLLDRARGTSVPGGRSGPS